MRQTDWSKMLVAIDRGGEGNRIDTLERLSSLQVLTEKIMRYIWPLMHKSAEREFMRQTRVRCLELQAEERKESKQTLWIDTEQFEDHDREKNGAEKEALDRMKR